MRAWSRPAPILSASWTPTDRWTRASCRRSAIPCSSGELELCLGARLAEPGAWPMHARLANRLIALELRRRTGAPLTDLGPMRCAPREQLLALELRDRAFGWPLEMVLAAAAAGWTIGETPITYRQRAGGVSKVTGSVRGTYRATRDMSRLLSAQTATR